MKKLSFLSVLVTLIFYHGAYAQQDSVYTLDKCLDYAFNNQASVKNAELDKQISQYKVNETRAYGLPQINFEGNTMYNIALQPFFLTNQNAANFGYPIAPNADPADIYAGKQLFQLKASNTATLNASQIIFDASYLVGLQASKTYAELATKSMTQTKIETTDKITNAFNY
jgi:outer membrane protein